MKTLSVLFLFFFFTFFGSAQITFQRTYPDFGRYGCSVIQTIDGGYAVCGCRVYSSDPIFLMKTDVFGDSLWIKFYEGSIMGYDHAFHQTPDGGFIICGIRDQNILLIRTDIKGDTVWEKILGAGYGNAVDITPDDGFIIAAEKNLKSVLIKTDSLGTIQWSKTFSFPNTLGPGSYSTPTNLICSYDGNFYMTGHCHEDSITTMFQDSYLLKTSFLGDSLWTKIYLSTPPFVSEINSLAQLPDNGFILAGVCWHGQFSITSYYGLLIRTNSMGEQLWKKLTYDSTSQFNSVISNSSGDFFITGGNYNEINFQESGILEHFKMNGDSSWIRHYKTTNNYLNSVSSCSDGGFIMCGYDYDNFGIFLVKTDSTGSANPYGIEEQKYPDGISVFPNPTSGLISIKSEFKIDSYELFSVTGISILKEGILNDRHLFTMDLGGIPSSIYFLKVFSEKGVIVKKIIRR